MANADDVLIQIRAEFQQAHASLDALKANLKQLRGGGEEAAGGMSKLEKAVAGTRTTIGGLDKDIVAFGRNLGSANDALVAMGINVPTTPMALFGQGVRAVGKFMGDAVSQTVDYNKSILDLSRNLGVSTEEISRIVQVADDFQISQDQVKTALQLAVKNGFAPSIESLAELADLYVGIQDPVERAAILTDKFGRNWAAITPILEGGGDAVRAQSAAISDSLIVTDEAVRKSEEYRLAVDSLSDSWQGFSQQVGNKAIPALTELLNLLGGLEGDRATSAANFINTAFAGTFLESKQSKLIRSATVSGENITLDMQERLRQPPAADMTSGLEDQTDATEALTRASQKYAAVMGGAVGRENERFVSTQNSTIRKIQELNTQIVEVNKKPWMPGAAGQVAALREQIQGLKGDLETNAQTHEKTQKEQILGFMQQQMAVDGLTTDEQQALMDIAEGWGLVDTATVQAWEKAKKFTEEIAATAQQAGFIGQAIDAIPAYKEVIVNIIVTGATQFASAWGRAKAAGKVAKSKKELREEGTEDTPRGASGLDFVVPAGYESDNFPVMASSGERVQITPQGKPGFSGGAGAGGGITIYGRTTIINGQSAQTNRRALLRSARVRA